MVLQLVAAVVAAAGAGVARKQQQLSRVFPSMQLLVLVLEEMLA